MVLDGVIEPFFGGPTNPGPWTVVERETGREPPGAACCTGTESDARQTADYFNRRAGCARYEARMR